MLSLHVIFGHFVLMCESGCNGIQYIDPKSGLGAVALSTVYNIRLLKFNLSRFFSEKNAPHTFKSI